MVVAHFLAAFVGLHAALALHYGVRRQGHAMLVLAKQVALMR